jgi:hypothetical protein
MEMADDTISSPPTKRLKTDSADKSKTRDYSLYRTFWNIQSFLSSDPKTLDAKSSWPSLLTDVETILLTFESDGFRKSEIESAKARCVPSPAPLRSSLPNGSIDPDGRLSSKPVHPLKTLSRRCSLSIIQRSTWAASSLPPHRSDPSAASPLYSA